ncbi:hypothetical protein F4804DRAFT_344897 [Jackrogersella minutella]|nr:hypothetical protein F4804DRAFT_344897 [Jackrogersella minutella]
MFARLAKTSGNLDINRRPQKRKVDIPKYDSREKKKRGLQGGAQLPSEILSMIISRAIDSEPRCALDLLVPDWNVCKQENPLLEILLELTRVVTYTRGLEGNDSSLTVSFDHGDDDILLPIKSLDGSILKLDKWCYNEAVRLFFQYSTQVFQLAADVVPNNIAEQYFLEHRGDCYPIRGQRSREFLHFDDEWPIVPKKQTPGGESYIFNLLRHIVVRSPLTLMDKEISDANLEAFDTAIDHDRSSPIWLSWSQMPMLESVLLDLRIYSHDLNTDRGCVGKDEIIRRAQEMGRWLKLKLLVIAGLQSYSFSTSYRSYTAGNIDKEDEMNGEPNWIKIFMCAVRPGGKLVLVDRLTDATPDIPHLSVER